MFNATSVKRFFQNKNNRLVVIIVATLILISAIVPLIVSALEDHRQTKAQAPLEEEHQYTKPTKAFEPVSISPMEKRRDSEFDRVYNKRSGSSLSGNKYVQNAQGNRAGKMFVKDGKAYKNVKIKDGCVYDQNGNLIGSTRGGMFVDEATSVNGQNVSHSPPVTAPFSLYAPSKGSSSGAPPQPGQYLPYGRWIPCVLSNTIETSSHNTPIIAVTTEAVYNQGKEVLPAGCEVHGYTAGMPVRDHVISQKNWTLVWRLPGSDSGQEIRLKGVALENGARGDSQHWKYSDGKLGIKGYVVDNRDMEKLQAIALQAISGAGQGLVSSKITTTGATSEQTFGGDWQSSVGEALNKSASLYAELLLKKVMEDGYFVVCPAGTKFYLYVEETILVKKSTRGGQPILN